MFMAAAARAALPRLLRRLCGGLSRARRLGAGGADEARAARLLPGLLLARVDGKSPVEYVTGESDKNRVRRTATALLLEPAARLADVRAAWAAEIGA